MTRLALTVVGFSLLLAPVRGQTPEQKQATVAYLHKLQKPSGGFVPAENANGPSLSSTTTAVRALKYFGNPLQETKSAQQFVDACFQPNTGAFVDRPGSEAATDVATTALGLMAVVDLKMPLNEYKDAGAKYLGQEAREFPQIRIAAAALESIQMKPPQADAWLKQLAKMRNADGTYGSGAALAFDTASVVVTVLRLGGQVEKRNVLKAIRGGQRADGAFGKAGTKQSDLASSYRIMRAFAMLKEKPNDTEAIRKFIARCRNSDGGYGVEPGQPSSVSGTYYAGIILHWLDELK